MIKYIIESANRAKNNRKQYELFGKIFIFIENPLPSNVSMQNVLTKIKETIPKNLLGELETIYVGDFKPLRDREVDSMYVNGAIMVSNNHESDKSLYNTLVHEFAHAIEDEFKNTIYLDGDITREFLAKRNVLYKMLKDDYDIDKSDFLNINFNQQFDDLIYKTIGYENVGLLTHGMFLSPYGCTSLREYFANCFEHYFIEGPEEVGKLCPTTAKKIKSLLTKK